MKIIDYQPELQPYFELLNKAWIEKYFSLEPLDKKVLLNPETEIIQRRGKIFFVAHENEIIGTVALIFICKGIYEMAKMAVNEKYQGLGAGKFLCQTVIKEARKLKANKIILYTNSKLQTAIAIYYKFGFKNIALQSEAYRRANTQMELTLNTIPTKWFDRKFDFNISFDEFPLILKNLEYSVLKFKEVTKNLSNTQLNVKLDNKWSIKEHIGHLGVLELLWQQRFIELKNKASEMSIADLNNTETKKANFNQYKVQDIIKKFEYERNITIALLRNISQGNFKNSLLHPRLNQRMRIVDLMHFVFEHDEHHYNAIINIINHHQ
jgi:N-acetylglutamate synthase-like GNAT family acetyltransferase